MFKARFLVLLELNNYMRFGFLFFTISLCASLYAQRGESARLDSVYTDSIRNIEYQLEGLSYNIINGADENERITSCYYFIQTLKKALQVPGSFDYEFTTLRTVSAIKPDNEAFRMFTWNLLLDSGKYMYFGAIQMNNDDSLQLFGLYDSSDYNRDIDYGTLDHRHWMGALVYQIHHYKYKRRDYYITFGWDGEDARSNKKVIDVLYFDEEGKPQFGEEIFDVEGDLRARMVFEFSDRAAMLCRYDKFEKAIVVANLVPINYMMKGNFETYIPDGTYNYFKLDKGIWRKYDLLFDDRREHSHDMRKY